MGGELAYRIDPDGLDLDQSWVASPSTYVAFHGRADYGRKSNLHFHVTSDDWQPSDRVLAAILTAAGAHTSPVAVGGYGTFDGVMTGPFSSPRIVGRFAGEAVRAFDVRWGRAVGDIVIENDYVTVKGGQIGNTPTSTIQADGLFSLGYPRKDGGQEIDAHVRVVDWPMVDFRHAFNLDDWPVDGTIGAADIRLTGAYTGPFGSGTLRIDKGVAWGETFETGAGSLTFNGTGLQISRIVLAKGPGRVDGSALIEWDDTYSFDAQGAKIPVESLTSIAIPKAPLSGVLQFSASGAGTFASPSYEFKGRVGDLFVGDEGIGAVSGVLQVHDKTLVIPQLDASSVRLQVSGSGSIALDSAYDASLMLRFTDTSIDPYVRYLAPSLAPKISPYTRATVSGSLQIQGELKNPDALGVIARIDEAHLTLFDYGIHNNGQVLLKYENGVATISHLDLAGEGTSLSVEGEIPATGGSMRVTAKGSANLAILQAFSPAFASSGAATLDATIAGDPAEPTFTGQAVITDGRLRYRSFPHGFDHINGPISFDASGIHVDGLTAKMGDGDVTFGGRIVLRGMVPEEFDLRAEGRSMRLRIPAGFISWVDANLTVRGPFNAPTVGGPVTVLHSAYAQEVSSDAALSMLTGLTSSAPAPGGGAAGTGGGVGATVRLDINVHAATSTLSIDTRDAQIFGSGNLAIGGTVDRPSVTGQVTIDRGNFFFTGNRYTVAPSSITFSNPARIEPFFDVQFDTRPHVQGQTYDITVRITGTVGSANSLNAQFSSDPPLPNYDILSLLMGEQPDLGTAEVRAKLSPQLAQQQFMRTAAAQLLTMPISSRVGSVVQRTIPFDTFSLVPLLGTEASLQQLTPTARLTLGKRISDRVFLTYSRELNATQYQVIVLEYEQSDRISWVLSRNEDRTFALDFRIRHVF